MLIKQVMRGVGVCALGTLCGLAWGDDQPATPAAPAAPAAAPAAPAASAGPTLGKILENSGVVASGYIDTAYSHADRYISGPNSFTDRVFDSQNDSLTLHQVGIQLAKQPKEGFGGLLNVTAGADVPVFASYPFNNGGSQFDVTQAFGQYASGPWTVIAGKYATLQGSEVIWAPSNNNFSRSILFGAIPFTHTGVRATYAATDTVSLIGGVNNGWDQVSAAQGSKTLELGATLNPVKPLNITISDLVGNAASEVGGAPASGEPTGSRNSFNFVGTYAVSDALTLGLEYLNVRQGNLVSTYDPPGTTAKYDGWALYGTYLFTPAWRLALRAETFDDKDGFHYGVNDTKYSEFTATLSWLQSDSFELRGELRGDHANNEVFVDHSGEQPSSKSLDTVAIEGILKF